MPSQIQNLHANTTHPTNLHERVWPTNVRVLRPGEFVLIPSGADHICMGSAPSNTIAKLGDGTQVAEWQRNAVLNKAANNVVFNPHLAGAICCVPEQNEVASTLLPADGNHRHEKLDNDYGNGVLADGSQVYVAVQILPGYGHETASYYFRTLNANRRNINARNYIHAAVFERQTVITRLVTIMAEYSIAFKLADGKAGPNETTAYGPLHDCFVIYGERHLRRVLEIMSGFRTTSDNTIERAALKAEFIKALSIFLRNYRHVRYTTLRGYLRRHHASRLFHDAMCKRESSSGNRQSSILQEMDLVLPASMRLNRARA